jgi:pyridinium-3,5-biscarboxylic acid mononucleotide sulfurtransferase
MTEPLDQKLRMAEKAISSLDGALVALSGGVDSSLLLALAVRALGPEKVLAVTALGPVESDEDARSAAEVAQLTGATHMVIHLDPLEIPEFPLNTPRRCYVCRLQLYAALEKIRAQEGLAAILDGAIADDAQDYRPGSQAASEAGVKRPLAEAGLTKEEVREASRQLRLPTAEKPASPCLASRFPYGEPITVEALSTVAQAESLLHGWGFPIVRVRHHGPVARIEVPAEQIRLLAEEPLRSKLVEALRRLGYAYVSLDLQGFRSGSLNEVLPD